MIKTPLSTMIGDAGIWTPGATTIGAFGTKKTFNQLIKSLFANNEQGFVYDPNDLSTMFQDAAGTVPVAGAGQVVGLLFDKSKGLVANELIGDVNFDNPANWTLQPSGITTITIANGVMSFNAITNDRAVQLSTNIVANKSYTITIDVVSYVRGDPLLIIGGVVVSIPKSVGKHTLKMFAATSSPVVGIYAGAAGSGGEWSATSISIKEIVGNHAYQTQAAMRPLLVASPQRLDYDIADDKLITNLPAQLTGCTVIRAVPNVGTQILTGQTIPTPYNDNTDHCGLIVINRALTATETAQITKLFNKAAGV